MTPDEAQAAMIAALTAYRATFTHLAGGAREVPLPKGDAMTYAEANQLLATVREARPGLFSGTVGRAYDSPDDFTVTWMVHLGPRYDVLFHNPAEWDAWQRAFPTDDTLPPALRYTPPEHPPWDAEGDPA